MKGAYLLLFVLAGLAAVVTIPLGAQANSLSVPPRSASIAATVVITGTGALPADIQSAVDAYRGVLGANNAVGGTFISGRREINWDGVPDNFAAPNNLPSNFFNANSPRGAVFSTAGAGFQVSANAANPTSAPVRFGNLNATYPANFATFSAQRLFTPLDSNTTDVSFFVPGTARPALVRGFGAVFTDVEHTNAASLTFFSGSANLGTFYAPVSPNGGLSFLGVDFGGKVVTRVRIVSGEAALGATALDITDGGAYDLVVMDDFIYGEPISPLLYLPLVAQQY